MEKTCGKKLKEIQDPYDLGHGTALSGYAKTYWYVCENGHQIGSSTKEVKCFEKK